MAHGDNGGPSRSDEGAPGTLSYQRALTVSKQGALLRRRRLMDVRNPPFTMFCRRLDRGLLRAHTKPSLGAWYARYPTCSGGSADGPYPPN